MGNLTDATKRLSELRKLPRGWNYGCGHPLSRTAQIFSLLILHFLDGIGAKKFDVLPTDDGGATIMASFNDDIAEIIVGRSGGIDLFLEAGEHQEFQELDFGGLIDALEGAGWQSRKSSGSRTHVFTVKSTGDLQAKPLLTMGKGRLLSQRNVRSLLVQPYVTISKNTIEESEGSRPFSFDSPQKTLLMAHG